MTPEEVALLVAAAELGSTDVPIAVVTTEQVGKLILIGPLHFPPEVNNPRRSLQAEERWHAGFRSLVKDRGLIRHDEGNVFLLSDKGWELIDRFRTSGKKGSDGGPIWEELVECLRNLAAAQQGEASAANTSAHDEVRRLAADVLRVSREYLSAAHTVEAAHEKGQWDAFICHASEDKESFVRPLAESLRQRGLAVWYDDFTLNVGDGLRRSIDRGLSQSRFGIVVLSHAFFQKEWPQRELDGLVAREVAGRKVILPVWHEVGFEEVKRYSPTLADRVAAKSSEGLEGVVRKLIAAMGVAGQLKGSVAARALRPEETPPPLEDMEKAAESEELSVSISQGVPESFVIIVKNESDSEVTIKRIVLSSKGIRLTDSAVPPPDKDWKVPAHGRLQVEWKATPDPTAKLRSIYDRWAWNPPEHLVPKAEIDFVFYCDAQGKPLKQSYKMLVYVDCNRRIVEL